MIGACLRRAQRFEPARLVVAEHERDQQQRRADDEADRADTRGARAALEFADDYQAAGDPRPEAADERRGHRRASLAGAD